MKRKGYTSTQWQPGCSRARLLLSLYVRSKTILYDQEFEFYFLGKKLAGNEGSETLRLAADLNGSNQLAEL